MRPRENENGRRKQDLTHPTPRNSPAPAYPPAPPSARHPPWASLSPNTPRRRWRHAVYAKELCGLASACAAKGAVAVAVRPKGLLLLRVCGRTAVGVPKVAEGGECSPAVAVHQGLRTRVNTIDEKGEEKKRENKDKRLEGSRVKRRNDTRDCSPRPPKGSGGSAQVDSRKRGTHVGKAPRVGLVSRRKKQEREVYEGLAESQRIKKGKRKARVRGGRLVSRRDASCHKTRCTKTQKMGDGRTKRLAALPSSPSVKRTKIERKPSPTSSTSIYPAATASSYPVDVPGRCAIPPRTSGLHKASKDPVTPASPVKASTRLPVATKLQGTLGASSAVLTSLCARNLIRLQSVLCSSLPSDILSPPPSLARAPQAAPIIGFRRTSYMLPVSVVFHHFPTTLGTRIQMHYRLCEHRVEQDRVDAIKDQYILVTSSQHVATRFKLSSRIPGTYPSFLPIVPNDASVPSNRNSTSSDQCVYVGILTATALQGSRCLQSTYSLQPSGPNKTEPGDGVGDNCVPTLSDPEAPTQREFQKTSAPSLDCDVWTYYTSERLTPTATKPRHIDPCTILGDEAVGDVREEGLVQMAWEPKEPS
ncbi:hypothetical protein B0H14DRAFT_3133433 [Mycena olivaceomarginata]|nr:hypothetical protein B0H14DRAFT_3133433 [Mycena olivaceomarginata]